MTNNFIFSPLQNAEEGSIWFDVKKSFIKSGSENTISLTSAIEYLAKDNKFVFLALHDVNVDNLMQVTHHFKIFISFAILLTYTCV